jgi:hypothetical protein
VCERSFEPAIVDQALASSTDRATWQALRDTLSRAERMDLVEQLNASLENIRFDKDEVDGDPARVALPVLFDLLPRLPEDRGW